MSTLAQRINQLRTAAVAAGDEYQLNLRTGELRSLYERLRAVADSLPGLVTAIRELRAGGALLDDTLKLDATSLAATIEELQVTLTTLRYDSPLEGPKGAARYIEAFVRRVRETVQVAWLARIDADTVLIDDELVEALHRGGADVEDLRQTLTDAESDLLILRNRALPQLGDMAKLTSAFAKRRDCSDRVRQLVPATVAEVILGAQLETGIPLSLMTTEVLGELDRLGIRERFRVTLR